MSEIEDIDINLLIDEKRPAIWNIDSEFHKNKILKWRAWEEMVLIFCDGNDTQDKKTNMGK